MEKTGVQKLARILKILVIAAFVCNLLVLPLAPFMVSCYSWKGAPDTFIKLVQSVLDAFADHIGGGFALLFQTPYRQVWQSPYTAVLTVFLWVCGGCCALILWQARRALDTVVAGTPFQKANAANMRRAGVCFFVISAAALARTIWGFFAYRSIAPLFTYNALFIPVFAMGGLLCMVMSALFRQAAELKEENDLTI